MNGRIESLEGRRLLAAGAPDVTFGAGGTVTTPLTLTDTRNSTSWADMLVNPDGFGDRGRAGGRGDLRVSGPNGFVQYAKFSGFTSEQDGRVVRAVYKLAAPLLEGTYSVRLVEGQVFDVNGLANDRQTVGTFLV